MRWLNGIKISNLGWFLTSMVLISLSGIASMALAAGESWTAISDIPTPRWGLSTCVVNGKIYAIGGGQSPYGTYLSTVEVYDPSTDTWTMKADMPTGRAFAGASVVNGKIYVVGGAPGQSSMTSTVEAYDPATDTWTRKADMPTRRAFLSTCVVDGKIYAIGGYMNGPTVFSTVEAYDPATDTWTKKADMPTAKFGLSTSVIYGKIYAMGGIMFELAGPSSSTMEEYDPATDTWTSKTDMPTTRGYLSTCVVNGKIYVIGGTKESWVIISTVDEYNPTTDTWTAKPDMHTARCMLSTSVVNGKIYAIGGSVKYWPWTPCSAVEEYDTGLGIPSPDFNGDGIVDSADMCMMIDYWGTDEQAFDIAPPPFGDGIVDVQDLVLLSEHLFDDYRALAQWKLDEKAGDIAPDSIGGHDGILYGEPLWQPTGGQIVGALEFDGIDDYVETDFVLDPADGAFSVFAWIQGGMPGQVIISQIDGDGAGETWLSTDAISGNLMTGLMPKKIGWITPRALVSESFITDIQWHNVGFVWDGSYRVLYVDGIEVAKDTAAQNPLKSADGGLYIGASKDLDAGSFFSGFIDDVRIYNQALTAEEIATLAQ